MATGEVRPGPDVEAAIDILFAPIYHRLLIGHQPLDPQLVDELLDGFAGFTGAAGETPGAGRHGVGAPADVAASNS